MARDELDGDGVTLVALALVVDVAECTRKAVVVDVAAAKSERVVAAVRPASGVDGASLRWAIELELPVGSNVASASFGVEQLAVVEGQSEG